MRLLRRLLYLIHRDRNAAELSEEIAHHREMLEQEQRDSGLSCGEASAAANRRMGNMTLARESARHIWLPVRIEELGQDLRYAWRGLVRSKSLTAVACLSLALSTGFGTALFSLVNAVLLQPVTAADPDGLVRFWVGQSNRVSWLNLHDLCEGGSGILCVGHRIEELRWVRGEESIRLSAQAVSPAYFSRLGINVAQGRAFTSSSDKENSNVAVVTDAFWRRRLEADAHVIGRTLVLSGHPYTIIGVLPRGFRSIWGLGISPSLYISAGSSVRPITHDRARAEYELLGILAPGQSFAEFRARLASAAAGLGAAYPAINREFNKAPAWQVHRLGLFLREEDNMTRVLLLFGAVIFVFVMLLTLVACTNVAGLLVARALSREREIAIRLSIGCGRFRLARLFLAESFLLAAVGISLGALLSIWLARLLVAVPLPFPIPFEVEVPLDTHLLAYLAVLLGIATIGAGLAPVLQASRLSVAGSTAHAPAALGFRRWSLRGILITGQIAVSTVLLIGTTLFVRSLWAVTQIDPGFDLNHVVTVETDTRSAQLTELQQLDYKRSAIARIRQVPGVTAVSGAMLIPLSMESLVHSLEVDRPERKDKRKEYVTVNSNRILPEYFQVMRIPVLAGRTFTGTDRRSKPQTAIVNETLARQLSPGQDVLGRRIRQPGERDDTPWAEIVGVVADSRYLTLGEAPRPVVYWPASPESAGYTIHVRTTGDPAVLSRDLPAVLRPLDPRVPVQAQPLRSVMSIALFPAQASAVLLAALGIVGWALTITGLYGLVSFTVARRVPEIGIRVALGATPFRILGLILRDGLAITGVGLTIGLILAALATPALAMFLAGVSPRDATSFLLVATGLIITAIAASYGPARRGTRLAPNEALRHD